MEQKYYWILISLFFLSSCSKMKEGVIVDKYYRPSSEYPVTTTTYNYVGNNSYPVINTYWVYDDEDYIIEVRGVSTKGDSISKTYYLDRTEWELKKVGDLICPEDLCDEDPVEEK